MVSVSVLSAHELAYIRRQWHVSTENALMYPWIPATRYMNHGANEAYAEKAVNNGYLEMPCLYIGAEYDGTCDHETLSPPQKEHIRDLTTSLIKSGHWMAQEKPVELNAVLAQWLVEKVSGVWPQPRL